MQQCNAIHDVQRTTHNMHAFIRTCVCVLCCACAPVRARAGVCHSVRHVCGVHRPCASERVYMAPVVLVEHLEKLRQNLIRDIDDVEVAP